MRTPVTFADDAYRQDVIAPVRVEHRFEFGDPCGNDDEGGARWGHAYNFVFYQFHESGALAEASYDIDDGEAFLRHVEPPDLMGDFAVRVLVFLSMRSDRICIATDAGIVPIDHFPVLAQIVAARRRTHMRAMGDG